MKTHYLTRLLTPSLCLGLALVLVIPTSPVFASNQPEITGKKPLAGHNVSHHDIRTKRKFYPNLQKKKFWPPTENYHITVKASDSALPNIETEMSKN